MSDTARDTTSRYVLLAPLVLVNTTAVYGQVMWATERFGAVQLAVVFALTLESIAVYLQYEAHVAQLAGDASLRLRLASYTVAGIVGALNYSHFAGPGLTPTPLAVAFGLLSASSPWLWAIRSRSLHRVELRAAGLIDPRSARFAVAKWVQFPIRTLRAYRWSVDHGERNERAAWEQSKKEETWQSEPASVTGGHEPIPAPDPAPPSPPSPRPAASSTPAPATASGTAASAGNGGRSAAPGSAAGPSSPTTSTAPGAAARSARRALTDEELVGLVRKHNLQHLSEKEIGSRLRSVEHVSFGQYRVGPAKRAALNGH